jgi:NAD(P)-dependent dehydrogenase (short-subunit alcohol dehydrogenase family)
MRTYSLYWLLTALTSCQAMSTSSTCAMKRILVTGGNKGIGKAIISRLLTEWKDTHVVMGARSLERGQQAIQDLIAELPGDIKDRLELLQLDTSSDESVKAAADKIANEPKLYGIINNAGVSGRTEYEMNECNIESANDPFLTRVHISIYCVCMCV